MSLRSARRTARRVIDFSLYAKTATLTSTTAAIPVTLGGTFVSFGTPQTLPALPTGYVYAIILDVQKASGLLTVTGASSLALRARWSTGDVTATLSTLSMPVGTNYFYAKTVTLLPGSAPAAATTVVLQFDDGGMEDFNTFTGTYTLISIPSPVSNKV